MCVSLSGRHIKRFFSHGTLYLRYRFCTCFVSVWNERQRSREPGRRLRKSLFRSKENRRTKRRRGDRYSASTSLVVACVKRLLPVALSIGQTGDYRLLQEAKTMFYRRESDDDIREFIRTGLVGNVRQRLLFENSAFHWKLIPRFSSLQLRIAYRWTDNFVDIKPSDCSFVCGRLFVLYVPNIV